MLRNGRVMPSWSTPAYLLRSDGAQVPSKYSGDLSAWDGLCCASDFCPSLGMAMGTPRHSGTIIVKS